MSLKTQTHIMCLVNVVTFGSLGKQVQQQVEKYIHCNGPRWTSDRMKVTWNIAKLLRNKDITLARSLANEANIKLTRKGFPVGPIGRIVEYFVTTKSPKVLKKTSAVLRSYTAFKASAPSKKDIDKVVKSISQPYTGDKLSLDWSILLLNKFADSLSKQVQEKVNNLTLYREDYTLTNLKPFTSVYSKQRYHRSDSHLPYGRALLSMLTTVPEGLEDLWSLLPKMGRLLNSIVGQCGPSEYVGRIQLLNESGFKTRAIAIPAAWVQFYFAPFHKHLERLTEILLPESMVKDQNLAGEIIRKKLSQGEFTGSSDLSSATDRFPLTLQLEVLKLFDLSMYIEPLRKISQGKWKLDSQTVSYTVGQPMGLYGSFPLFNLTHGLLIKSIQLELIDRGIVPKSKEPMFLLLGDDVIFFNKKLKNAYDQMLRNLGIDVSKHKSFSGNTTEFAGFLISKIGRKPRNKEALVSVFRPFKHTFSAYNGHQVTFNNILNFFHSCGSKNAIASSVPKWSKIYEAYLLTAKYRNYDLTPILSDDKVITANQPGFTNQGAVSIINRLYQNRKVGDYGYYLLPDYQKLDKVEPIVYDSFKKGINVVLNPQLREIRKLEARPEMVRSDSTALGRALSDPLVKEGLAMIEARQETGVARVHDPHYVDDNNLPDESLSDSGNQNSTDTNSKAMSSAFDSFYKMISARWFWISIRTNEIFDNVRSIFSHKTETSKKGFKFSYDDDPYKISNPEEVPWMAPMNSLLDQIQANSPVIREKEPEQIKVARDAVSEISESMVRSQTYKIVNTPATVDHVVQQQQQKSISPVVKSNLDLVTPKTGGSITKKKKPSKDKAKPYTR